MPARKGRATPSVGNTNGHTDWDSIITCINEIEAGADDVPAEKYLKYNQMKRIIRRTGNYHRHPTRDGVIAIAKTFDLSLRKVKTLYVKTFELETRYQLSHYLDSAPAPKATAKILRSRKKALGIISTFYSEPTPKVHLALNSIKYAATTWAAKQTPETIEQYGFEKIKIDDDRFNYGADVVVHNWFAVAPLMLRFVEEAIERLDEMSREPNPFEGDTSAIVTLVGGDLPKLYEDIFGEEYGDSYDAYVGSSRSSKKVNFLNEVLKLLNLLALKPDTIKSYRTRFKAVQGDGATGV
tara:strand:- start:95424 stop:96311 length:888 start_codon:yes stop_codon:yes gene_type:complete